MCLLHGGAKLKERRLAAVCAASSALSCLKHHRPAQYHMASTDSQAVCSIDLCGMSLRHDGYFSWLSSAYTAVSRLTRAALVAGGKYSDAYCLKNLFEDTGDCYCSSSG